MYQYHSAFVYMARNYLGVNMPPDFCWDTWNWQYQYLTDVEAKWMATEAVDLGLFRYGHVMKGAIIAVRELAQQHELIVVTHRPKNAVKDTLAWLTYVDLPFVGVNILSGRTPKTSVPWDLLIDDKPDNLDDAIGHNRAAVLFDQPWNKEYRTRYRSDWKEMGETVNAALRT